MIVNWIEDGYGNMSCHDNSVTGSALQSKVADISFVDGVWFVNRDEGRDGPFELREAMKHVLKIVGGKRINEF